jgi:hypothetical protein
MGTEERYRGVNHVQKVKVQVQGIEIVVIPPNGRKGGTRASALKGRERPAIRESETISDAVRILRLFILYIIYAH